MEPKDEETGESRDLPVSSPPVSESLCLTVYSPRSSEHYPPLPCSQSKHPPSISKKHEAVTSPLNSGFLRPSSKLPSSSPSGPNNHGGGCDHICVSVSTAAMMYKREGRGRSRAGVLLRTVIVTRSMGRKGGLRPYMGHPASKPTYNSECLQNANTNANFQTDDVLR